MTSEPTTHSEPPPGDTPARIPSNGAFICLHFLEAAHCGTGQEGNGVKKQIQREAQTGWPTIWRRSVKGAIRSACCESVYRESRTPYPSRAETNKESPELKAAFGPAEVSDANDGQAGALKLSPASILAFPVCSQAGVFAWVTCPDVFRRLKQTFFARRFDNLLGDLPDWPELEHPQFFTGEIITHADSSLRITSDGNNQVVRLGSMQFKNVPYEQGNNPLNAIVEWFEKYARHSYQPNDIFKKRLAMVSDEAFGYLTRFATEKVQGNALDYDSKTVTDGKLFSIEYLPQETLMYLTVSATDEMSTGQAPLSSDALFGFLKKSLELTDNIMQFGGGQSTDCGVASLRFTQAMPNEKKKPSGEDEESAEEPKAS